MAPTVHPPPPQTDTPVQLGFAAVYGALLGLALLKFGNPVIMGDQIAPPENVFEWALSAWPIGLGQGLLTVILLAGLFAIRRPTGTPSWILMAPLPWLVWQFVSATGTVNTSLTAQTLIHFSTNVACFYAGLLALGSTRNLKWFWSALILAFALVLLSGWQQHFGGLAATRELFWSEIYPHVRGEISDEWVKRMSSDRIFATLFYPNTLAGVVLLLTPVCIGLFPSLRLPGSVRRVGLSLVVVLALGCLVWSGSKAGWLLALGLGTLAMLRLDFSRKLKLSFMLLILVAGAGGFVWKYSDYLRKGAPSTVARLDYWEAAFKTAAAYPVRGTGPGTFGKAYEQLKRPESEMAKLTHNDFLQQASDSGWPGCVLFTGFVMAVMTHLGRRVWRGPAGGCFWIWLGLLGIWLQAAGEFWLYIPAISWLTMTLMGWLAAGTNDLDKPESPNLTSCIT